jgi:hyperosmotically inducible periplasmic protein
MRMENQRTMKKIIPVLASFLLAGLLSVNLAAQTSSAARYDATIQTAATRKLAENKKFQNVKSSVQDGIVTLTGTVDLYQDKLDAAKTARKLKNAQGVRNLLTVAGPAVTDAQLQEQLSRKLYYDRVGWYDNPFNYFTLSVNNGVVTLGGQTYDDVGRDSALALLQRTPGVKDIENEVKVSPVSLFDDSIRLRAVRAIYGYPTLNKYAIDPARPIRIIVDNGHISLYGTVINDMDKQIAGIRANQVFGAFSVENNLVVENSSKQGL